MPPGCRNNKRYQDVLAILNAGINVICAFNVQHLDSLKDVVERVTGVVIREPCPTASSNRLIRIVNLDLATEDLIDRLGGKSMPKEDFRSGELLPGRESVGLA